MVYLLVQNKIARLGFKRFYSFVVERDIIVGFESTTI